jgi:hypothetical protein
MKRITVLVTVLAIATLGLAIPAGAGESCHNINAWGVGEDLDGSNTVAQIRGGGLLQGTTAASFVPTGGVFPEVLIAGQVTFTTNRATLTVDVTGTVDFGTGAFTAEGPVSDATGKLEGATGYLVFEGVEDLTNFPNFPLPFTETVTGEICVDLGGNGKRK